MVKKGIIHSPVLCGTTVMCWMNVINYLYWPVTLTSGLVFSFSSSGSKLFLFFSQSDL